MCYTWSLCILKYLNACHSILNLKSQDEIAELEYEPQPVSLLLSPNYTTV